MLRASEKSFTSPNKSSNESSPESYPPNAECSKRQRLQRTRRGVALQMFLLIIGFGGSCAAIAQVAPSAYRGGERLNVGGTFSAYHLDYGSRNLLGASAFVDANLNYHLGLEAEVRWLELHQQQSVHDETYLIGPRYAFNTIGRWQPYAKVLVGNGQFNFPYSYAHGGYLVLAPGGGLDFRIGHRFHVRAIDFEYQDWPGFTGGSFSSVGLSSGLEYRIR